MPGMSIRSSLLYMPCPCGSGKKFKFCCHEAVRSRLPDDPSESDISAAVRKVSQPWGMVNDVDPIEDREAIRLMEDGIKARDEGEVDEAIRLFRKSRTERPRLYTSWNNEAHCLWMKGEVDEAVRVLEEGLGHSDEVNAFGWGLLAIFRHCMDDDGAERDRCIARALEIRPMTAEAAGEVCQALALAGRHRELLDYALGSGFRDSPVVAALGGVAALNCGCPDPDDPMTNADRALFER